MARRLAALALFAVVAGGCDAPGPSASGERSVDSDGKPSSTPSHERQIVPDYASYPAVPVARRPNAPPDEDLDCKDFSGPVYIGEMDPHDLDRDADGLGCE